MTLRSLAGRAKERLIEARLPTVVELKAFDSTGVKFQATNLSEYARITEHGYETEYTAAMLGALHPDDVLFDIGGNIGMVCLHAARICETYSFEPDPEFADTLAASAALNPDAEINLQRLAIGDADGEVTLYTDGSAGNSPSLVHQPSDSRGSVTVEARSLDSLTGAGELPLPTVVKMDIEGAEILALRGGSSMLSDPETGPRALFIEVHDAFLPGFGSSAEEVLGLIADYGFSRKSYEAVRNRERHLIVERD